MAIIELCGLTKVFPNGVAAVSAVDLTVGEGVFFALVGPSGSGKSTLLRLIAGLENPSAGTVRIDGRDVTGWSPRDRNVALVFQEPALYPYLSVFDNLAFSLRARRCGRAEVRSRVEEVAASLGLGGVLGRRPQTLSGGQKQRVALGRAIVRRPALFLFDEPLSSLDAPLRASIRGDLMDLHRRLGATMIYVTHDQAEALATGDRVGVLERGRVEQAGTPREVYERPSTRFVAGFVGSPPMSFLPFVVTGGAARFRLGLETDEEFTLPVPLAAREGGRVELGLRPEFVAVARDAEAHDPGTTWLGRVARVARVEYLGHETIVTLQIGPHEVRARRPARAGVHPGELVDVGFDLDRASWFDPESGLALPPEGAA